MPDKERIVEFFGVVLKTLHLANLLVAVAGDIHRLLLDLAIALEAIADEVVVLTKDLSSRTREVQTHLGNVRTQVVDAE